MLRRFLSLAALTLWLGGLTSYAAFVVPAATAVLGNRVVPGFITERVTLILGRLALVAVGLLGWNLVAVIARGNPGKRLILWAVGSLIVLAGTQVALGFLHESLENLLDREHQRVADPARFYGLHRAYLWVATAQIASGYLHLACLPALWRRDRALSAAPDA